MIRRPTSAAIAFAWHTNAIKGVYGDLSDIHDDEPCCGWFKRRLVKGGVHVAARIWLDSCVDDETGDLVADETLQCEVDGRYADAYAEWPWLCGHPISKAEYDYLVALSQHARTHEPDHPAADPRQPVDWLTAPIPFQSKGA